jgi:N6-L-threonylcarbamoyladenine synthase
VATFVAAHPHLKASHLPEPGAAIRAEDWPDELRLACASLNWAIASTLGVKLERAMDSLAEPPRALMAAGGVAANGRIRETLAVLAEKRGLPLFLPEPALCADNATMIALAGWHLASAGLAHDLTLDAVPRGRKVPWDYRCLAPEELGQGRRQ